MGLLCFQPFWIVLAEVRKKRLGVDRAGMACSKRPGLESNPGCCSMTQLYDVCELLGHQTSM